MNERQAKVMSDAFQTLSAGAQKGKRMIKEGATLADVQRHVLAIDEIVDVMKKSIANAMGAANVIDIATKANARAKTLSGSRRS